MLARGRIGISIDDLLELLNLPEEVDVIGIEITKDRMIDLHIASGEPIEGVTTVTKYGDIRRVNAKSLLNEKNEDDDVEIGEEEIARFVNFVREKLISDEFKKGRLF